MATKVYMTDGNRTVNILSAHMKGLDVWDESTPGVWTPDPNDLQKQAKSARLVPSVFAGVSARMQAMADLPFSIYGKGDKLVDSSDLYKNAVGFLPNPYRVFSLTEGALVLTGQAYWYKGKGERTGQVKELKYWRPDSVQIDTHAAGKGEVVLIRAGADKKYPGDEVLHIWGDDPMVEFGPPIVSPFASAMTAAQANGAITQWVAEYMQRGAIKAMMLMVEGMPPKSEVEKMETWFNRFMRGMRSLQWKVFNASGVKPTIIGDGLEALRDLSITEDLRYEVHQALGTRHLLEDENFATAKARERQFYQMTIMPDARKVQSEVNTQILEPMGYHLEFEPERLESFQEDEAEQVQSFGALIDVLMKGLSFDVAFKIAADKMDYQFSDEQMAMITADLAKKPEEDAPEDEEEKDAKEEKPFDDKTPNAKALLELDRWEKKSARAGKVVTWHTALLSEPMVKALADGSMTFEEARAALKVNPDSVARLAEAIEKAVNEIAIA